MPGLDPGIHLSSAGSPDERSDIRDLETQTQFPHVATLMRATVLNKTANGEGPGVFAPSPSFISISQPVSRVL